MGNRDIIIIILCFASIIIFGLNMFNEIINVSIELDRQIKIMDDNIDIQLLNKQKQITQLIILNNNITNENIKLTYIIERLNYDIELKDYEIETARAQIKSRDNIIQYADTQFYNSFELKTRPTYKEVMDFINQDKTDEKLWVKDTYDCTQFSNEVVKNSLKNGIFSCIVEIDMDNYLDDNYDGNVDEGHMLITFNTLDKGIIYIEPQSDETVELDIGLNYWKYFYSGSNSTSMIVLYTSCFT